ncbi:MAG: DUF2953 domain-containing protein [Oscillospiraceae bacterium]|jgi:hypothetical protein|nr:DUF2953 domain-containing protein [Oscillospiraceae bacterium]
MGWLAPLLLFLLCALLPVRVWLCLNVGHAVTLHCVARIGGLRLRYDGAVTRQNGRLTLTLRRLDGKNANAPGREATWRDALRWARLWRAYPRVGAYLRRMACVQHLAVDAALGTGNAARTALLCGAADALLCRAAQRRGKGWGSCHFRLRPDYGRAVFLCTADCIIALRLGHIIHGILLALAHWMAFKLGAVGGVAHKAALDGAKKAVAVWKGIQSKV